MYDLKMSLSFRIEYADRVEMVDALKVAGIDTVDIDLCTTFKEPYEVQENELNKFESRLDFLKSKGIDFNAVHISFGELWALETEDENARINAVQRTLNISRRAGVYGIKTAVVHTNGLDFSQYKDRETGIVQLRKSLTELSQKSPLTIAVENLPRNCLGNTADELLRIINGIGVKIVVDTNHFLREKPQEAIFKLGSNIVTLHISDYDGKDEKHWLPGEGIIDWNAVIGALKAIGYVGVFNYETNISSPADIKNAVENKMRLFENFNRQDA